MSIEKDTEIKSRYEDYSVEELQEALNAIFDSADEFTDADVERMDEIMAVLNRKNPLPRRYTAEESLKHFRENYSEELSRLGVRNTGEVMEKEAEKAANIDADVVVPIAHAGKVYSASASSESTHGKVSQKLIRTALIAAAVVALMVIITVSAAAAGINIWGWVPVWNDSTFRYVPEETAIRTSLDIPSALKSIGVDEPLFPTWLPDGFLIDEQQIQMDDPAYFFISYLNKDRVLMIVITSIIDTPSLGTTEKDELEPILYTHSGHNHFIFSNLDKAVATFQNDSFIVRISGDISIEEMMKIIDSIYEDEE